MDLLLILLLILLNGVFAMSEIAVVSSRKARLQNLSDDGSLGAEAALKLHQEPSSFLSTIQVGITLVGILNGAVGEAADAVEHRHVDQLAEQERQHRAGIGAQRGMGGQAEHVIDAGRIAVGHDLGSTIVPVAADGDAGTYANSIFYGDLLATIYTEEATECLPDFLRNIS